ncbi:MAG TPA: hydrolase [Verrucomicrobiales bacterium]|nr:hydrolase [Verrucomicrobiales bacterium]
MDNRPDGNVSPAIPKVAKPNAHLPMNEGVSRRVIFNADDFGRSHAINEAVVRAHREGVLTTASLMVNGDAFDEAVTLAHQHPALGVGLHLTLVMGRATLPPAQIPGLVNADGAFTDNPVAAGMGAFFKRSLRPQLEAEIAAQIAKFRSTGLLMDHLNGHLNFHLHPTIFGILTRLLSPTGVAADVRRLHSTESSGAAVGTEEGQSLLTSATTVSGFGVPPIRLTRDFFWLNAGIARGQWLYRVSHAIIFHLLSWRARPVLRRLGSRHTDAVFGLLQNARVTEDYLLKLLPRLPAGDSEIYSHPCLETFPEEFAALTSPFVKGLAKKLGIQLCRHQDL